MDSIADIRKEYKKKSFAESDAVANPFEQFDAWWKEATESNIDEVNAMTLATVNAEGKPSARIVLLKGVTDNGFKFFTNYESKKAQDIFSNNHVALVIFWKELERQIRIEGKIEKMPENESDEYFASRPLQSRIGAWSSPQSTIIKGREILENAVASYEKQFEGIEIERPAFWGGYLVRPMLFEFWQGRPSRLHDRIQYVKENDHWHKQRLAP